MSAKTDIPVCAYSINSRDTCGREHYKAEKTCFINSYLYNESHASRQLLVRRLTPSVGRVGTISVSRNVYCTFRF